MNDFVGFLLCFRQHFMYVLLLSAFCNSCCSQLLPVWAKVLLKKSFFPLLGFKKKVYT